MNETERKTYLEQFNRRTHVLGRIVSAITLVLLVGDFILGAYTALLAYMAGKTGRYLILGDEKELDIAALEKIAPIHRLSLEEIFGY